MMPVDVVLMGQHDRHTAIADLRRKQDDFLILAADRPFRALDKVQRPAEFLLALPEQRPAHLHVRIGALSALTNDIIQIDKALAVAEIKAPDLPFAVVAGHIDRQLRRGMTRAGLHRRIAERRTLADVDPDAACTRLIGWQQLDVDQMQLGTVRDMNLNLLRAALAPRQNNLIAFSRLDENLFLFSILTETLRHAGFVDAQPAPRPHRNLRKYILLHHIPP